jgi:DNA polymerase-3 subunit delta
LLHILHGEDDFSIKESLGEIKAGLGDEASLATSTTVLQGQSVTPAELMATCDTVPFLAPCRLVIVEGLLGRFEQQGKAPRSRKSTNDGWRSLAEYAKRMPGSTVLVLLEGKLSRSNPLLKQLAPLADVREFRPLGGYDLALWIQRRAEQRGGTVTREAASLLAALVGSNLWILSSEIEKLCVYAPGRPISKDDVELLVASAREPSVFVMIDAILDGKAPAATRLLHSLENEGAAPPYLLFMITRQFRMVLQAKDLLQRKRRPAEIGSALGIASEFALKKTMDQARKHPPARLQAIYRRLLDTDIAIKTGRFRGDRGELALDLLVSDLCGQDRQAEPGSRIMRS